MRQWMVRDKILAFSYLVSEMAGPTHDESRISSTFFLYSSFAQKRRGSFPYLTYHAGVLDTSPLIMFRQSIEVIEEIESHKHFRNETSSSRPFFAWPGSPDYT